MWETFHVISTLKVFYFRDIKNFAKCRRERILILTKLKVYLQIYWRVDYFVISFLIRKMFWFLLSMNPWTFSNPRNKKTKQKLRNLGNLNAQKGFENGGSEGYACWQNYPVDDFGAELGMKRMIYHERND